MTMNIVIDKKGYITIETAIALPIFMIAVLTMAFSMRVVHFQETAVFRAGNSARLLMQSAAVMPWNPTFPSMLENEIREILPELDDVSVNEYRYMYDDDLISFKLILRSNTGLPGKMTGDYQTKHAFLMRAFTGKDNSLHRENLDSETENEIVCVISPYGEKYHGHNCTFVTPHPFKTAMSDKISKEYIPCAKCRPDRKELTEVYIFRYGDSYHTAKCRFISKCIVEMSKEEAIDNGYTVCSKCGGED